MSKKLERVREDIRKTEAKARELDEYLKTLRQQEKQLEDEYIVRQIRNLKGKDEDILEIMNRVRQMHGEENMKEEGEYFEE